MMKSIGITDLGLRRENNEDSIFIHDDNYGSLPNLYIVADGMGGNNSGEIASSRAIEYFCQYVRNNSFSNDEDILDFITSGIAFSNSRIYEDSTANEELAGMGTTMTVCSVKNSKVYIAHIGDSRLYIVGGGSMAQLTTDHSYVNEMVKAGEITEVEARVHPKRNIITRALGVHESVEVDGRLIMAYANDHLLLCSDGLTNMITDQEIYSTITENSDIKLKAEKLIRLAIENGGHDNISVILISID